MSIKAIFWDFGGVITSSPFDSFNNYESNNNLPKNFIRSVNSQNQKNNAWARLEKDIISIEEFNNEFYEESEELGHAIQGKDVLSLLKGNLRPEMIKALRKIQGKLIQACLTNNIQSLNKELGEEENISISQSQDSQIMGLFDFVVESSKINIRKPEIGFYEFACKKAQVRPEEVIFLDDLGINLKPARDLGMKTIKVLGSKDALEELQSFLPFSIS